MLLSMSRADKYLPTGNNYVSLARFDFCEQLPNDNFEICFHRFVAQLYFKMGERLYMWASLGLRRQGLLGSHPVESYKFCFPVTVNR